MELPGGTTWQRRVYDVGVKFLDPPEELVQTVHDLYGGVPRIDEVPFRILIVGDDRQLNALLERTLSSVGYFTVIADNPKHIVTRAKKIQADAVVVNLLVELERSVWWVLELLSADQTTRDTPLVVLAEPASLLPDVRRYLTERRVRFITLPLTPEELLTALDRALREAAQRPQ